MYHALSITHVQGPLCNCPLSLLFIKRFYARVMIDMHNGKYAYGEMFDTSNSINSHRHHLPMDGHAAVPSA